MFTSTDLELIQSLSTNFPSLSRTELALTICENLAWTAPNGKPRLHSCLLLLEELAAAGVVKVADKQKRKSYRPMRMRAEPLPVVEIETKLRDLRPVAVETVPPQEQAVWDATMAAYHPQSFKRAFGAHQRYWVIGQYGEQGVVLGLLLFAAAARHVAVRDAALGWTRLQQRQFRQRVVANSRFLILPGVHVPHLASHVLSLALRRLPEDWRERFGYAPVLVETFVTPPWRGTCYRAAGWQHLGQTTGQGRQDRQYDQPGTVRDVFIHPLVRDWQCALVAPDASQVKETISQGGDTGMITAQQAWNEMTEQCIQNRIEALAPFLDEKQRRLLVAAEAKTYGAGGIERVAALAGMATSTVRAGLRELQNPESIETDRVRRPGGGRKPLVQTDPTLLEDLKVLVDPETRGDPQSPLRWTCKSTRQLAKELNAKGHTVSHVMVAELLRQLGYSLQATRKMREGTDHPDRDAQFQHIGATVQDFQQRSQPVISVDTKKKELVGDFKNVGTEWQPKGQPEEVRVHDFMDRELGKVSPYGVYDLTRNEGWVNVGTDHDTATFAVTSVRGWWQNMGRTEYPDATELLITADGGGSNSSRSRLWKVELQKLVNDTGLRVTVCHFPPGTSKWNKVEHRLFSHITQNWRGRPLTTHEVVVNLIANTTTSAGLTVQCQLDNNTYPTGVKVSDAELKQVEVERSDFHGEWNYAICPHVDG